MKITILFVLLCCAPGFAQGSDPLDDLRQAGGQATLPEQPIDFEHPTWRSRAEPVVAANQKSYRLLERAAAAKRGSFAASSLEPDRLRDLKELLSLRGRVAIARNDWPELQVTARAMIQLSAHLSHSATLSDGLRAYSWASAGLDLLQRGVTQLGPEGLKGTLKILELPLAVRVSALCEGEARAVAKLAPDQAETFSEVSRVWRVLEPMRGPKRAGRVTELRKEHSDHVPYLRILKTLLAVDAKRRQVAELQHVVETHAKAALEQAKMPR